MYNLQNIPKGLGVSGFLLKRAYTGWGLDPTSPGAGTMGKSMETAANKQLPSSNPLPKQADLIFKHFPFAVVPLSRFEKHMQKYDADTTTPGIQFKSGDTDKIPGMLGDTFTARRAYEVSQHLNEENVAGFKKSVDNYAEQAWNNDPNNKDKPISADWKKNWINTNYPFYNQVDQIRMLGTNVSKRTDGSWNNDWHKGASHIYTKLNDYKKTYKLSDYNQAMQKWLSEAKPKEIEEFKPYLENVVGAINAASPATKSGISSVFPGVNTQQFVDLHNVGLDNVQSMLYMQNAEKDNSLLWQPGGKDHLQRATAVMNDRSKHTAIRSLGINPAKYANQLSFYNNNYNELNNLNNFRENPIWFILSNLFSGDPSNLYSAIDSMGKMYGAGKQADWHRYLVGDNKQMQGMGDYLPWLQMIGNIRSFLGGDGYRYKNIFGDE